ncbi:MAG TPA: 50S ribosomal protein L37e [archaeon]|nr:50S ribosomal protein L37e [archaeon]
MVSKGTSSFGKHNKITHIRCRRCGHHSYHINKKTCAYCGFPAPRLRKFGWQWKRVLTRERKR